jgi:hypothetical protein
LVYQEISPRKGFGAVYRVRADGSDARPYTG